MDWKEKKVLVIGTGISGIAATDLLVQVGADVILYDGNEELQEEIIREKLKNSHNVKIMIGTCGDETKKQIEYVVVSPGVPIDNPLVEELRNMGKKILGEIELAYTIAKGKIAAITGTNGKTTTTALVGEILRTYYKSVFVVGNIGIPYTGVALDIGEDAVVAAEISSFQLETVDKFCPKVSAVLNITPDHLNRHYTMENYSDAKLQITKNQTKNEICVLNYEDPILIEKAKSISARVFYFSSEHTLEEGIYLTKEGKIILASQGTKIEVCHIDELNLLGKHNYENVMAGVAIGYFMGVPMECIKQALHTFVAVEHRIEYVTEKNGVKYYNDSKGTNPDAAIQGIRAMVSKTILIGGGYDKGSVYDEWIEAFDGKVKLLVLLGQTAEKIADTAKAHGFQNIVIVSSLEEAVKVSAEHALPGEAVLLSPACASWGMFKNYEERGNMFKEYVKNM
ncbi:MAG: UDP-N-acetylmuramoyl-L-alanine--D-glutamate ligase [Lachnospiraceae bacterium]|nr:UDP-N-acetylmuramoyl-L-alanine--D-glutamate ligase [Lachnospiraceae bacterium]